MRLTPTPDLIVAFFADGEGVMVLVRFVPALAGLVVGPSPPEFSTESVLLAGLGERR
ncbi:MAG: hypothetical protein IPK13_01725 [Deltaproteobacteria bacterium]|nr:hypothetical protein [Deltaproteobacteria bacterium]